ncbi:MAG: response regulator [Bdellovibrionales bacterium]|nr:response regulator [Bdellovibrionales bacterium]
MKSLVVEDDFITRKLLQKILSEFGEVDVAVNGDEAIEAFQLARNQATPYNVIFLDIRLPGLDGHGALRALRKRESELGITEPDTVKVVMTTGVTEKNEVLSAFREGCEAYLKKPFERAAILDTLKNLGLIQG